jgi:hypothetical protein
MDTGILYSVRNTLIQAFMSFPYIMIWFIGFLAMGLGNLGLFILFIGHAIFVPIIVSLVHMFVAWKAPPFDDTSPYFIPAQIEGKSKAQVVPSHAGTDRFINVSPSYWMAHTLFLFGYMFGNAISILALPNNPKVDKILQANRKSRAMTVFTSILFFTAVMIALRYQTHTERPYGIGIAVVVGGLGGFAWYKFAETCGIRSADVFGIAQQVVIPSQAKDEKPMTCVYTAKP